MRFFFFFFVRFLFLLWILVMVWPMHSVLDSKFLTLVLVGFLVRRIWILDLSSSSYLWFLVLVIDLNLYSRFLCLVYISWVVSKSCVSNATLGYGWVVNLLDRDYLKIKSHQKLILRQHPYHLKIKS